MGTALRLSNIQALSLAGHGRSFGSELFFHHTFSPPSSVFGSLLCTEFPAPPAGALFSSAVRAVTPAITITCLLPVRSFLLFRQDPVRDPGGALCLFHAEIVRLPAAELQQLTLCRDFLSQAVGQFILTLPALWRLNAYLLRGLILFRRVLSPNVVVTQCRKVQSAGAASHQRP